jgi:hypothetical protein
MAYLPHHLNSARGFEASNESPVSKDQIESHWLLKGPQGELFVSAFYTRNVWWLPRAIMNSTTRHWAV